MPDSAEPLSRPAGLDVDALLELAEKWAHKSRTSPEEMEAWRDVFYGPFPLLCEYVKRLEARVRRCNQRINLENHIPYRKTRLKR